MKATDQLYSTEGQQLMQERDVCRYSKLPDPLQSELFKIR